MFTRKRGLLFFFILQIDSFLNFNCASPARQLAPRASLHGKHSRTCWTLPVTSCSCRVPRPLWTEPSGRDLLPPAGLQPHVRAAMTSPAHKKKQTSQSEGLSTRAHELRSSVTCTVHSANRTHRAGHVEFHTRAHVQNPSVPNSRPSLAFVRLRDQLIHRVRFRTGS